MQKNLVRYTGNRILIFIFILLPFAISIKAGAQKIRYDVSHAHAHNDYLHPVPFYTAYEAGFGSIEADVFFRDSQLYVAHQVKAIDGIRTLQSLYLEPLQQEINQHNGYVFADPKKKLLLLIDIKTDADSTLHAILQVLNQYPAITGCPVLKIVITGNQPDVFRFETFPSYLYFDGHLDQAYSKKALKKIALFSDNFKNYSQWNGEGTPDAVGREKIETAVKKAHALHKPIRFWGGPDTPVTWLWMMHMHVDYLNTDKISEIAEFLKIPRKL